MAETKSKTDEDSGVKRSEPATNGFDQPSNLESTIRDAKHPKEKPDPATVAQVEEIKGE